MTTPTDMDLTHTETRTESVKKQDKLGACDQTGRTISRRNLIAGLLGTAGASTVVGCDPTFSKHVSQTDSAIQAIPAISGCWVSFDNVDQMRTNSGNEVIADGMFAQLEGYHTPNDGGGGVFCFRESDAPLPDDGGTVILSNVGGNWIRIFEGAVNVRWFGAKGEEIPADYNAATSSNPYHIDYIAIQSAIDTMYKDGGGTVLVPAGTYSMSGTIVVRANVTLELSVDATIRRNFNCSPIYNESTNQWKTHSFLIGRLDTDVVAENITIRGGILDGNGVNFENHVAGELGGFNIFQGRKFKNLVIEGTEFRDVVNCHSIDFAASEKVTIRNCKFFGFKTLYSSPDSMSRHFSESIQIDPDILGDFADGTTSSNVIVEGCTFGRSSLDNSGESPFGAIACGVGNHAAHTSPGKFHENIVIANNTFNQCGYAGIHVFNFLNTLIYGNIFNSCTRGVYSDTSWANAESSSALTIDSNTFLGSVKGNISFRNYRAYATEEFSGQFDTFRTEEVKHKNVIVSNNKFSDSPSVPGVSLSWCCEVVMSGNYATNVRGLVRMEYASEVTISSNTCDGCTSCAIWLHESETSVKGDGLSHDITINSNTLKNWLDHRCIHINAAFRHIAILNNSLTIDSWVHTKSAFAIQADSHASKITISNNLIEEHRGLPMPRGIYLSGSTTGVIVSGNMSDWGYKIYSDGNDVNVLSETLPNGNFLAPADYC